MEIKWLMQLQLQYTIQYATSRDSIQKLQLSAESKSCQYYQTLQN